MTDDPGADERRVRHWLRRRGVGPDAPLQPGSAVLTAPRRTARPAAPAPAPAPAPMIGADRLPAWRDPKPDLTPAAPPAPDPIDPADPDPDPTEADPDPDPEPDPDPDPANSAAKHKRRIRTRTRTPAQPADEIHAAAENVAEALFTDPQQRQRILHVAYNHTAAALGQSVGLLPWMRENLDYYGRHSTSNGAAVGVGVIVVCLLVEIRSHHWRGRGAPIALRFLGWVTRVPLACAVLALALYSPNTPDL
ncbi:hypothetical protein ACIQUY_29345 [Streptomyces sp. NPDC090231]|uniref:hypothetical protein n=1 Tax=unclassified Streptomyces TaxID=2593676 RepID=UPI003823882A